MRLRLRSVGGRFGLAVAGLLVLVALLAPVLSPHAPEAMDLATELAPPRPGHPLGTGENGIDLLTQPEDEKVALGIPLAGSILGLGIGTWATRTDGAVQEALRGGPDGALVGLRDGRLSLGTPSPTPAFVSSGRAGRTGWRPALGLTVFRAEF